MASRIKEPCISLVGVQVPERSPRVIVHLGKDPLRLPLLESEFEKVEFGSLDRILDPEHQSSKKIPQCRKVLSPRLWTRALFHSTRDGQIARSLDRQEIAEGHSEINRICKNSYTEGLAGTRQRSHDGYYRPPHKRRVKLHPIYDRNPLLLAYYRVRSVPHFNIE
jgi:hypothetical protein